MQLLTDHAQFYDSIFDEAPPTFERSAYTRGGLDKPGQFRLFARLGLNTPPHGTVQEIRRRLMEPNGPLGPPRAAADDVGCVVYADVLAHRGEGKRLLPLGQAAREHPDAYATLYVPPFGDPLTFRYVRFGQMGFWLRQRGAGSGWRSNVGEQEDVLERIVETTANPVPRVLWAIDFIPSVQGLLAIDFNTAPDLATLGESAALSPAEVRAILNDAAARNPRWLAQL